MDAQVFGIIFWVVLGIMVILVILKVQSLLRGKPSRQPTHEHLGSFEEQEDGSQVRYCLTCNFKEVVPAPARVDCDMGRHNWGKWVELPNGINKRGVDGVMRNLYAQQRFCLSCGFIENQTIKSI